LVSDRTLDLAEVDLTAANRRCACVKHSSIV